MGRLSSCSASWSHSAGYAEFTHFVFWFINIQPGHCLIMARCPLLLVRFSLRPHHKTQCAAYNTVSVFRYVEGGRGRRRDGVA